MDPSMATGPAQLDRLALPRADDGAHALGHHQCADNSKESHVGNTDRDIELADCAQCREKPDAKGGADYAASEQHEGECKIDRSASPIADGARHRGSGDVAGDA